MKEEVKHRFSKFVELIPFHTCWEWIGYTDKDGYGTFSLDGWPIKAHRLSYQIHSGSIPGGMLICHICDNPGCVNPKHLFIGTPKQNANDRDSKGRTVGMNKTHCSNGHEYNSENTYFRPNGGRDCKLCKKENWTRWYKKKLNRKS